MTEEYKNNVLRQLTGQVVEGSGTNRPMFITTNPGEDTINSYIVSQGYDATHTFLYKFSYTRNNQQLLFYEEQVEGFPLSWFILITDMNFIPIGLIKNWNSGTAFKQWLYPIDNDIGEGRIYFTDVESGTYRIVYMNDPTSKKTGDSYEAELLASYNMQLNDPTHEHLWNIAKSEEEGKFAISTFNNSTNKISIIEFIVNVGSANEWNYYTYNTAVPGFSGDCALYPIWGQAFECRLCFVAIETYPVIKVLHTQDNGGTLSLVLQSTIQLPDSIQSYTNDIYNLTMRDYNYVYCYSQGLAIDNDPTNVLEVDLNNEVMNILFTTPNFDYFYFNVVNGQIFFLRQDNNNGVRSLYFGMITNHEYYEIYISTYDNYLAFPFVINSYNLYSARLLLNINGDDMIYKLYVIYNDFNYNGASYNGIQSVISNSVILDDNNGLPIFARNLYNKTITQNTVESTVEIPAYQLNGINIAEQKLISKNNNNIIFKYNDIEKNIYETVLMNFFNTLTIIDNNENKNKVMTNASSYFVNGLESQEYDNMKALKYRVTYTDNTTYLGTIVEMTMDNNTNTATLGFMFYSGVGVSKVEILSNDETVTYATVDETYNPNSYYKVVQEVVIN